MAGLLGGMMGKIGGLLSDPKMKQALLASFASGGDPYATGQIVMARQQQDAEAERARQMEEYRQLQMAEARRQAEEAQKRQAQEIIARTTLQHFSENPNAIAFGGPQGNPQTQLAGLLSRGVDPTAAGGLISAGAGPKPTTLQSNLIAMGIDPQSPQGRQIMMQQMLKPQTAVNMGANIPAPPSGWWYNNPNDPSAGLYRIPGGPADVEASTTAATDERRKQGTLAQIGQVTNTIDETIKLADRWTTGSIGGIAKILPETDARKLAGNILTIKANLGFDRLQKMRDESPTGGALGQVAVQELEGLQATVAMLDQLQKPEDVRAALAKIRGHYQAWADAVNQANSGVQPAPQPEQPDIDALVRKYTSGN